MNYIGIDLGGTNIKGALVSAEGEILKEHSIPTRVDLGPEAVAGRIGQVIAQLSIGEDTVGGVGVGCPGTVDDASGIVRFAANLNFVNFDLRSALRKLSSIARRRCCITMTTGTSPRVDARVLTELGVGAELNRDYIYAFGMLAQAGFEPEVRYIHSSRKDSFESKDDAFGDFSQMIDIGAPTLSEVERLQAQANLREWLAEHLVDNPEAGMPDKKGYPQGPLTLDYQRIVPWAFISWNAKDGQL